MSFSKNNGGITGNIHGFQFFGLFGGLRIVEIVEFDKCLVDIFLKIEHSLFVYDAIEACMARGTLFHEFGKETRSIRVLPFFWYLVEDAITHTLSAPVGNDLPFIYKNVVF